MGLKVFCGEALCKAPVALPSPTGAPWPVRCGACGTALYPAEVLVRLPPSELEPKRAELMTERAGLRVSVSASDFPERARPPAPTPEPGGDIERILAMVDHDPPVAGTPPVQRSRAMGRSRESDPPTSQKSGSEGATTRSRAVPFVLAALIVVAVALAVWLAH